MKKITTLFEKNPENLGLVTDSLNPENAWVFRYLECIPTRKYDGAACAIINGSLYKRYDAKKGKKAPDGAIPCQEPDEITGHHPHWVLCDPFNPADRYFVEAFGLLREAGAVEDGTYELIGEKVQGNPEKIQGHILVKHGAERVDVKGYDFETLKAFLSDPANDIEGIVFHHKTDGRMCKIRKSDFGVKR